MPQQTLEAEHYILDAVIPGTPVRWSLLVHSDWSIEFRSQDTEARTLSAHTDASILVPGQVTHLRVVVEVTDSLQSRIAMLINGVERATASLDALLLAPNAIEMYDMYSNRRWDGERQRWLIAVCEMMMIKRAWVSPDRESSLQYFLSKKNDDKLKGVSYDDGAFGLRARGEANLKFDGSTKQIVVQEWLAASTE
jgi:hypothetical protein